MGCYWCDSLAQKRSYIQRMGRDPPAGLKEASCHFSAAAKKWVLPTSERAWKSTFPSRASGGPSAPANLGLHQSRELSYPHPGFWHRNGEMKSVVLSLYIHGHWLHEYTHQCSGNALGFLQLHPSPAFVSRCLSMTHSPEVGKARCHLTNRTCTCLLCGTVVKNLPKTNLETNEPKDFLLKSEIIRTLTSTSPPFQSIMHLKLFKVWNSVYKVSKISDKCNLE